MTAPLLDIAEMSISYGGTRRIHPVSFEIRPAERVAIVGESGSGKSSIANAIGGFLPAAGTVAATRMSFDGASLLDLTVGRMPERREGVSMIFQDAMSSLDPVWTVGSQLLAVLPRKKYGNRKQRKEVAEERLRQVGITEPPRVMTARPDELSGGMRQRVMLAIALASEPRLLIADEPTSALDATLAITVMELMVELSRKEDAALVFISHDIALARRYADRVLVMKDGTIVEEIASVNLAHAHHPYTRGLLACMPSLGAADADRLPTLDSVMAEVAA